MGTSILNGVALCLTLLLDEGKFPETVYVMLDAALRTLDTAFAYVGYGFAYVRYGFFVRYTDFAYVYGFGLDWRNNFPVE